MKKLKIFYPKVHSNFGDVLTPIIYEKALGYQVEYSPRFFSEAIGIGSLLQTFLKPANTLKYNVLCTVEKLLLPPVKVMGSGFIAPAGFNGYLEEFRRHMEFMAVRGEYSRKRVEQLTGKAFPELALGDPGLLLPMVFEHTKVTKKHKYGIIAHRFDMGNPLIQKLAEALPGAALINVLGDPMDIARQIAECDIIVSTAMHGLIAADSFGIPNVWITVSDKLEGGSYKFNDYYSVFGVERQPFNLKSETLTSAVAETRAQANAIPMDQVERVQATLVKALKA